MTEKQVQPNPDVGPKIALTLPGAVVLALLFHSPRR
jgi:hypothetical protein